MTYQYLESGLDNVFLENGFTVHKTPYGEGISIQDSDELHKVITRWLIELPRPLNGAELRFLRLEMNMTQRNLAAALGADEQAVRRWEKARAEPFNGSADRLIRLIACDYMGGDGKLRELIDRLAQLDQVDYAEARFTEESGRWELAA